MHWTEVFVGLGGNIGNSINVLQSALENLDVLPEIKGLKASRYYLTSPVSEIPQNVFVNAVCSFKTCLCPRSLFKVLEEIEKKLGKVPKAKNAPRTIDLDILFYGDKQFQDDVLEIPHSRWNERLFVLAPLSDIIEDLRVPQDNVIKLINIGTFLNSFTNPHNERVSVIS